PALAGRVDWMSGLVVVQRGRPADAAALFRRALASLETAKRWTDASSLRTLLAATLHILGDEDGEWSQRSRGPRALAAGADPRRRATALADTTLSCLADGAPWAAVLAQEFAIDVARRGADPVDTADAQLILARARHAVGDRDGAREALAASRVEAR